MLNVALCSLWYNGQAVHTVAGLLAGPLAAGHRHIGPFRIDGEGAPSRRPDRRALARLRRRAEVDLGRGVRQGPDGGGALHLGRKEGKDLVYMGKVGTGWSRPVSSLALIET
jgi:hypothetical protein